MIAPAACMLGQVDVVGVGVERRVQLLEFAQPGEELAMERGAEDLAERVELRTVRFGEPRLGQQQAGQVALTDRHGPLAVIGRVEVKVEDRLVDEGLLDVRLAFDVTATLDLGFGIEQGLGFRGEFGKLRFFERSLVGFVLDRGNRTFREDFHGARPSVRSTSVASTAALSRELFVVMSQTILFYLIRRPPRPLNHGPRID